jgi:hypothetical protein
MGLFLALKSTFYATIPLYFLHHTEIFSKFLQNLRKAKKLEKSAILLWHEKVCNMCLNWIHEKGKN